MSRIDKTALYATAALLSVGFGSFANAAEPLQSYNIDRDQITVSGISSGGYMASQFHVAYSDMISGAGIVAGGPYRCADSRPADPAFTRTVTGTTVCSSIFSLWGTSGPKIFAGPPPLQPLLDLTREDAARNVIANPENLCNDRVYLFSGRSDDVVPTSVVEVLRDYYREFVNCDGATENTIRFEIIEDAPHAFLTNDDPDSRPCEAGQPYITDCDYEMAREILSHMYGDLNDEASDADMTDVIAFDQSEFRRHDGARLNDVGHVYVPTACGNNEVCALHVAFHGCLQTQQHVGDQFFAGAGYNSWAESNNIIVLYPQTTSSPNANPSACWDFWSYTRADFYQRGGLQPAAVWAMIERLMGE